MNNFLKKQAAGFYITAASIILAVIAMISYAVMARDGENTPSSVYLMTLAAIAIQLCVIAFNQSKAGKAYYNNASFLAALLSAFCLVHFITGRMEWLGGLAAHNANFTPLHASFFAAVIFYVLTMAACIAASFCKQVKEES